MTAPPSRAAEHCGPGDGQQADARVVLQGTQFVPKDVSLSQPGMSVCWEHQDGSVGHSITFDPPSSPVDYPGPACYPGGPADDCFQQGDQAFKIVFSTGGTYPYHCKIHSGMTGTVTVAGATGTRATTSTTVRRRSSTTRASGGPSTTVGTLAQVTTTTSDSVNSTTSSSSSTTSSTVNLTTTTRPETALGDKGDGDNPSGVLEAIGVILLAAVIAALIPSWRRLT